PPRHPPDSTPSPYATLFRSRHRRGHSPPSRLPADPGVRRLYPRPALPPASRAAWLPTLDPPVRSLRPPGRTRRGTGLSRRLACRSEEHTFELQSRENLVCRL